MPQDVTRIVAIRHGETSWNAGTRIQGHTDIALNDTGRWQAARMAEALADEAFAAVYASDLQRAWQTAQALAARVGIAPVADPRLRERAFGSFEGATFKEIETRWPHEAERWRRRDPDFAPAGGETLAVFYRRCVEATLDLASRHPGQQIALVAHGGVLDCLYRAAARVELRASRTWQLGNTGINRLLCSDQGLVLVGWGDVRHLEQASDADAPRDDAGA